MTKKARLKLIKKICESHGKFCGFMFAPNKEDIDDEISRLPCRPDAREPNEEFLLVYDQIFEGGQ
jgi:hypothetical protein